MGSIRPASAAQGHSEHAQSENEISEMAESLIAQSGDDADIVAARRADELFQAGKVAEATQWLNVFRRVAMSRSTR